MVNINQLMIGGEYYCGYYVDSQIWLPLSCNLCNSSSSNIINMNAQRDREQLNQQRASIYELSKGRGDRDHREDASENNHRIFGPGHRFVWGKVRDYATVEDLTVSSAVEHLLIQALNSHGYTLAGTVKKQN